MIGQLTGVVGTVGMKLPAALAALIPPDRYAVFAKALGVEPGLFVRNILRFYDPITHDLLFPQPLPIPANSQ